MSRHVAVAISPTWAATFEPPPVEVFGVLFPAAVARAVLDALAVLVVGNEPIDGRLLVVDAEGGVSVHRREVYAAELASESNPLARRIQRAKVRPGWAIAVLFGNGDARLEALNLGRLRLQIREQARRAAP